MKTRYLQGAQRISDGLWHWGAWEIERVDYNLRPPLYMAFARVPTATPGVWEVFTKHADRLRDLVFELNAAGFVPLQEAAR